MESRQAAIEKRSRSGRIIKGGPIELRRGRPPVHLAIELDTREADRSRLWWDGAPLFINQTSETSVPQPPVFRQRVTSDFNPLPTRGSFFSDKVSCPSAVTAFGTSNSKKSATFAGNSRLSASRTSSA